MCGAIWISSANGASFCQVDIIRPVVKFNPWRTAGIQKCRGARPIFSARAIMIMVSAIGWVRLLMFHSPVIQALVMLAKRMVAAAVAWVRKYLVAASMARG